MKGYAGRTMTAVQISAVPSATHKVAVAAMSTTASGAAATVRHMEEVPGLSLSGKSQRGMHRDEDSDFFATFRALVTQEMVRSIGTANDGAMRLGILNGATLVIDTVQLIKVWLKGASF